MGFQGRCRISQGVSSGFRIVSEVSKVLQGCTMVFQRLWRDDPEVFGGFQEGTRDVPRGFQGFSGGSRNVSRVFL